MTENKEFAKTYFKTDEYYFNIFIRGKMSGKEYAAISRKLVEADDKLLAECGGLTFAPSGGNLSIRNKNE